MKECVKCGEDDLDKFEVNKVIGFKIYYRSYCKSCHKQYNNAQVKIDRRETQKRTKSQIIGT